ncbi:cytochrome P450 [Alicyclobacillus sp. TC]|uniref:cytochrome P450 n=1 Tax=Alicyclobacillus sp. TC TaxID=2606450 RepID=UPI0019333C28|nr:cytochrome P450 [Alicyclobacillus sp. TC]
MSTDILQRPLGLQPVNGLSSQEARINPFPFFQRMREINAVRYDNAREAWDIFRYQDVKRILTDNENFSSLRPDQQVPLMVSLISKDPPTHTQLRFRIEKILNPQFLETRLSQLESSVDTLLLHTIPRGEMEFIHDIAEPLPFMVIARLLGIPESDWPNIRRWAKQLHANPHWNIDAAKINEIRMIQNQARKDTLDYFQSQLKDRLDKPQDDLLTMLVTHDTQSEALNINEATEFCLLMLTAGLQSATLFLGNVMRRWVEEPYLQEMLRQEPQILGTMIEELLRYYPPMLATTRYAIHDVQINRLSILRGARVVVWIGSANRDDEVFEQGEKFQPKRQPNPHLSFGSGIHACLASFLVRQLASIVLPKFNKTMESIRLIPGHGLTPIQHNFFFGVEKLPIQFLPNLP